MARVKCCRLTIALPSRVRLAADSVFGACSEQQRYTSSARIPITRRHLTREAPLRCRIQSILEAPIIVARMWQATCRLHICRPEAISTQQANLSQAPTLGTASKSTWGFCKAFVQDVVCYHSGSTLGIARVGLHSPWQHRMRCWPIPSPSLTCP
jgi:hypothetical protein